MKDEKWWDVGTEGSWDCVPLQGQKRGLDWRFASERPSNSAPQTLDCLFLAPVGAVKQGQGQFTSNSTTSGSKLQLPIFTISFLKQSIYMDEMLFIRKNANTTREKETK